MSLSASDGVAYALCSGDRYGAYPYQYLMHAIHFSCPERDSRKVDNTITASNSSFMPKKSTYFPSIHDATKRLNRTRTSCHLESVVYYQHFSSQPFRLMFMSPHLLSLPLLPSPFVSSFPLPPQQHHQPRKRNPQATKPPPSRNQNPSFTSTAELPHGGETVSEASGVPSKLTKSLQVESQISLKAANTRLLTFLATVYVP